MVTRIAIVNVKNIDDVKDCYQNVLYLYYYEGYSTNEIASILNKKIIR